MANREHLEPLLKGVEVWNAWRREHPEIRWPDLSLAELEGADLGGADLSRTNLFRARLGSAKFHGADLERADLRRAHLSFADFSGARLTDTDLSLTDLTGANFEQMKLPGVILTQADLEAAKLQGADLTNGNLLYAKLRRADLRGAHLTGANLLGAFLEDADLRGAHLQSADLSLSTLVKANLAGADLRNATVFGASVWKTDLTGAIQKDLQISDASEPLVTVDELEVAQFVHLMLHNPNIRKVIDTIGRKGVLILGRFTPERKAVLDAIRNALRERGFVPMLFDFDRPPDRSFTETIVTLAGMSLFVIADITNPSSSPLELQATIPTFNIPFAPIIQRGEKPFSMFQDLQASFGQDSGRLLALLTYPSTDTLIRALDKAIIEPAVVRSRELAAAKVAPVRTHDAEDYL